MGAREIVVVRGKVVMGDVSSGFRARMFRALAAQGTIPRMPATSEAPDARDVPAAPVESRGGARHRRPLALTLLAFFVFAIAPTLTPVRHALSWPLIVHVADARGDAAYVMHGGPALDERLRAAADLFHMGRVPRILLYDDPERSSFNFAEGESWTRTQWSLSFLAWLGVPRERVVLIEDRGGSAFGSLHEADLVSAQAARLGIGSLVVVTSPVHTRRSGLSFRRRLPEGVTATTYAATIFESSAEAHAPLWLEYLKLVVYALIA